MVRLDLEVLEELQKLSQGPLDTPNAVIRRMLPLEGKAAWRRGGGFELAGSFPRPADDSPLEVDVAALVHGLREGKTAFVSIEPTKRNRRRLSATLQWQGLKTIVRGEGNGIRVWPNGELGFMPNGRPVQE